MNRLLSLFFLPFFIFSSAAIAADRVVVIPLGGSSNLSSDWQGVWAADVHFNNGDVVNYNGSSYVCISRHTSSESTDPASSPSLWAMLAAKGDKGDKGDAGPEGPVGPAGTSSWTDGDSGQVSTSDKVGIGTTSPGSELVVVGQITVTGGSPGAGKVLTSDVNGLASWEAISPTTSTGVVVVESAGQVWMDRNLGALRPALLSPADADAYGGLFQWGRFNDGHADRNSGTTNTLSPLDVPGHSDFITQGALPHDWRTPQNDNLWQGASGVNNPCPAGFRLPTEAEWETERASWSSNNSAGAFASPLKLVMAGHRKRSDGTVPVAGILGIYWSSTPMPVSTATYSRRLYYDSGSASVSSGGRAFGYSVRCLKD